MLRSSSCPLGCRDVPNEDLIQARLLTVDWADAKRCLLLCRCRQLNMVMGNNLFSFFEECCAERYYEDHVTVAKLVSFFPFLASQLGLAAALGWRVDFLRLPSPPHPDL